MTDSPAASPRVALVIGGAGFIGSHLALALLARGWRVRVLDDLSTGYAANLAGAGPYGAAFTFTRGSILDRAALAQAMAGVDCAFHLAALTAVPECLENPRQSIELNDLGAYNVFEAAAAAGARRVVFSSSSAVYGEAPVPHHEGLTPQPDTPYAIHKLLGEHYARFFTQYRGLETVSLRYFNVYGPRQRADSPYSGVISLFLDALARGGAGTVFGDGRQTRDFVYVADVAEANILAALAPARLASGRFFNVGSGQSTTVLQLYAHLAALCGRDAAPSLAPARAGDILHSGGPIALAAEALGFRPRVGLAEGLRLTRDWFNGEAR